MVGCFVMMNELDVIDVSELDIEVVFLFNDVCCYFF